MGEGRKQPEAKEPEGAEVGRFGPGKSQVDGGCSRVERRWTPVDVR